MHLSFLQHFAHCRLPIGGIPAVAMVAVVLSMMIPIVVLLLVFYTKHQREKLWHETARIALEKGQPIPTRPLSDEEMALQPPPGVDANQWYRDRSRWRRGKDLRVGLILIAIGVAIHLAWHQEGGYTHDGRAIGSYIMIGLGAAMMINGLVEGFSSRRSADNDRTPRA